MFHHPTRPSDFVRRALVLGAILGAGAAVAAAQTNPAASAGTQTAPSLNLQVPAVDIGDQGLFSSSATGNDEVASNAGHLNLPDAMVQYNGGRRYGRPRYRGGNTNQDGSSKYAFLVGAGLSQPVGNTYHYYTPSYGFQVGGGRNFNKNLGVLVQFDYDHLGLNGRTLAQQSYVYFGDANPSDNGLDANAHIWSFSLDPVYNIAVNEGLGAYIIGGVGFYHKVTNFTLPTQGEVCDYYYGCYVINENVNADHYTSNAPGFNGGLGFTYKLSRFSNERLYAEARYVVTLNSQRQGLSFANLSQYGGNGSTYTGSNFFPQNSNRTTYIPIKFGLRF